MTYEELTETELHDIEAIDGNDNGYNENNKKFYKAWREDNIGLTTDYDDSASIEHEYNQLLELL